MDSSSESKTHVVVGLDLGTTFSGISYATITQREVKSFMWVDSHRSPKIPTKLKGLHPNNVEDSHTNIEWFKLGLPHPDDLPLDIKNSPKFKELNLTREAAGLKAKDATAIFIKNIWKVFLDDLRKKIPYPYITIHVTVPVLWPEDACGAMYEALHRAEILNENVALAPKFLAEPEAAALAFFSDSHYFEETNTSKLKPGQTVLVCDCGGGTVCSSLLKDTVAYGISSTHPFRVEEILPGQCIFAGACLLDDGFMKLLKEKVETIISPRAFQALTKSELYDITCDRWDDDLASIFDPVVGKITHLIEKEMLGISAKLSNDVTHLVVAGGFGRNDYLRKRIEETVARVSPTTNILSYPPGHGWNAVSMGAVAHALQEQAMQQSVTVTSRLARAGWGVGADRGNSIFWLVEENESLGATQPNLRLIPPEALSTGDRAGRDGFSIRVYRRQLQGEAPRTREVCILSWKTRDVGLNSDMKPILKADLQIGFKWDGAAMDFSLVYGGIEQSSVEVEYPGKRKG
ncbi:hypothetical protein F52700_2525 [Fusarium sp. NRRL 52700]|nr:hypothetical protein F52700_2525 [Fusarium sp. NRRL 52700]